MKKILYIGTDKIWKGFEAPEKQDYNYIHNYQATFNARKSAIERAKQLMR